MALLSKVARVVLPLAFFVVGSAGVLADGATPAAPGAPAVAAPAVTAPDPSVWQDVITGQIAAFRKGDGAGALTFAAQKFKDAYADPSVFLMSIAASGYAPIFTSTSESFGDFRQLAPNEVMQVVHLVGPNNQRFEADYVLGLEPGGWRVQGVQLSADSSVAA